MVKSITSCLGAKEVVADMLDAYEDACAEDTALEAAMTVFSKKKQLEFVDENTSKGKPSPRGNDTTPNKNSNDLFAHIPKAKASLEKSAEKAKLVMPALNFSAMPTMSQKNVRKSSRYE